MFKRLLLTGSLLLLAACSSPPPTLLPTPPGDRVTVEEEAVYAALLAELYAAPSYVLLNATATDLLGTENTNQTLEYVLPNLRDVDPGTVDNFGVRNETPHPVRPDMNLGADYVLLSRVEMSAIFGENQNGWQVFYSLHPEAPGITTLSQVGFNAAFDQALVYVGTQSHWLAGAGYYVLLVKVEGTWVVDQQVMTWIS